MKVRKIAVMVVVLTLLFGTAALAESISSNIRVVVNKKEIQDAGILVDNKGYVAIGTLAKSIQAMLAWDNEEKKLTINKPNVHLSTMNSNNESFISRTKDRHKFRVHAQVDSLKTDIYSLKITITDPYGDDTLIEARNRGDEDFPSDMEDFFLNTKEISYHFKYAGRYAVRFWMKPAGDFPMQVVSEKSIIVK